MHHASEAKRVQQATALTEYARVKSSGEPTGTLKRALAIGDFNTVNSSDRTARFLGRALNLIPDYLLPEEGLITDARGVLKGDAYECFRRAGFRDANLQRLPTYPTPKLQLLGGRVTIPPVFRVDHILHTEDIETITSTVHKGEPFDHASDHYPLSALISV